MNSCFLFQFVRPDGHRATIASNGQRYCVQADQDAVAIDFHKLGKAISHLEARGYSIDIDNIRTF